MIEAEEEMSSQLESAFLPPMPADARRRIWPTVLLAALVVAIASMTAAAPRLLPHNRSSHQTGSDPAARYPATLDGALATTLHLMSGQVELSPPPAGSLATVAVSWRRALSTCWTSGGLCYPQLIGHVYLADFTMAYSQPKARLGWIIDYRGGRCVPYGHPPALPSPPPSAQPTISAYDCRVMNIVDPRTGGLLWSLREGDQSYQRQLVDAGS